MGAYEWQWTLIAIHEVPWRLFLAYTPPLLNINGLSLVVNVEEARCAPMAVESAARLARCTNGVWVVPILMIFDQDQSYSLIVRVLPTNYDEED